MSASLRADKYFFWTVCAMALLGFFILTSASMGLMARSKGADFSGTIGQQGIFGLAGGAVLFLIAARIKYKFWSRISLALFTASLVLTGLVFLPQFGFSHGGATRWIDVGPLFFQPSEILKFALVVYLASWLSSKKRDIRNFKSGFLPFFGIAAAAGVPVVLQKDIGTLSVLIAGCLTLFFLAGGKIKHFLLALLIIAIAVGSLILVEPYRINRLKVFFNPGHDPQGASYQLSQSMLAIGSGGLFGKGFGMSVQKFKYLPEPVGDSIFAVYAEEFGFAGAVFLIGLFLFFLFRGFLIAIRAPDDFGRLAAAGIVIMIIVQSFINIAAMVGIFPVTGVPLAFVSKGGTSLMVVLIEAGVLLNISKYGRNKK